MSRMDERLDKYLIVIEKTSTGFSAYSPDILGCITTGKTVEVTKENMKSALIFHFKSILEDGEEIPQARGIESYLEATEDFEEGDYLTYLAKDIFDGLNNSTDISNLIQPQLDLVEGY